MSFSALLKRSKLATFNPAIDQVYTARSSEAGRNNFGLKRSLALPTKSRAPYIRLNALDNSMKRTEYRKGTSEALFTKKWSEVNVGFTPTLQRESHLQSINLQSTLVPGRFIDQKNQLSRPISSSTKSSINDQFNRNKSPNYFSMTEPEFKDFLQSLHSKRDHFKAFLKTALALPQADKVDLFSRAQGTTLEVTSRIEQFLVSLPDQPELRQIPSLEPFSPAPAPHPFLALQYGSPTLLESAFAAPTPGRMLGSAANRKSGGKSSAIILGQINGLIPSQIRNATNTIFYPDEGTPPTRSNAPGRAEFSLAPTMDFTSHIERLSAEARRGAKPYANDNRGISVSSQIKSSLLEGKMGLTLAASVVTERPVVVGSMKYIAQAAGRGPVSPSTDLMNRTLGSLKRDSLREPYTKDEKRNRNLSVKDLVSSRSADKYNINMRTERGKQGAKRPNDSPSSLLNDLSSIIDKKHTQGKK